MNIESDHFKTLEELIDTIKMWVKVEEEFYSRYFGLNEMNILVNEIERLNKELETIKDNFDFNLGAIENIRKENHILEERISKAIEYIENEIPCLWEVDDIWEDTDGNYQHNYKEYDTQILLDILKGE